MRTAYQTPTPGRAWIWAPLLSLILLTASATVAPAAVKDENLLGRYETASPVNGSDKGTLTRRAGGKLRWTQDDSTRWDVTPDIPNGVLTGSPNINLQFYGTVGNSAVEALLVNGKTYFRKFTINSTWATTATANHLIDGPYIIWWDLSQNFSTHATNVLANLKEVRNRCWAYGMWDTPTNRSGYYQNVYLTSVGDTLSWPTGINGIRTDDNGFPYFSTPGSYDSSQNHYHEGFHLFQYSGNSPGILQTSTGNVWFVEASANWFARLEFFEGLTTVSAIWSNPQLPMWRSWNANNAEPWEPQNWNREVQQYARESFLYYLTEFKGVSRDTIAGSFYAGTSLLPQEYLSSQIGAANFRQYFTEWTAHNAAYFDYFSRAQWNESLNELNNVGDPNDINPYIATYTDAGTGGAWVSPPSNLTPRSWGYNLYRIINSATVNYTFTLDGGATGTEGAASRFSGTVVVLDAAGNQFHSLTMTTNTAGSVTVAVPASASEVFLVVNAIPDQFNGNQNYPYQVKIDRELPPDTTLPSPNPMSFAVAPAPVSVNGDPLSTLTAGTLAGNNPATGAPWQPGDSYRLAIVTSATTQATSPDISTYNAFVQGLADAAGLGAATWKVIGSTATVDARDNTGTNPGTDGTGVAVYLMDGSTLFASGNSDLWDGANVALNLDENGNVLNADRIFTGSAVNGIQAASSDQVLGGTSGNVQTGRSDTAGGNWMTDFNMVATAPQRVFALSDPITVSVAGDPETQITMIATTATDDSGVEYYFAETSGKPGGSDSGWQDSPVYTDSGLQPGTTYTYTVKVQDKSPNHNATAASAGASATTAGSAGFSGWVLGPFPSGLPLSDTNPLLDYDGGGLPTSIEWVLGGDPTDGSDDLIVAPTFDNHSDVDYFIYSYRLSNEASTDPNTTVLVEYGSDLVGWTGASDDGSDIIETSTPGTEFSTVEVKLKRTLAIGGRLFARLGVALTP